MQSASDLILTALTTNIQSKDPFGSKRRREEKKNVTSKRFSTWQIFERKSHSSADCTRAAL